MAFCSAVCALFTSSFSRLVASWSAVSAFFSGLTSGTSVSSLVGTLSNSRLAGFCSTCFNSLITFGGAAIACSASGMMAFCSGLVATITSLTAGSTGSTEATSTLPAAGASTSTGAAASTAAVPEDVTQSLQAMALPTARELQQQQQQQKLQLMAAALRDMRAQAAQQEERTASFAVMAVQQYQQRELEAGNGALLEAQLAAMQGRLAAAVARACSA
jgi:hypothetical protein